MFDRICRGCAIVLIAVAALLLIDDFMMLAASSPKFSLWQMFVDFMILIFAMLSV